MSTRRRFGGEFFLYLVAVSWTGPPAGCCPGGSPTPLMPGSAQRRSLRL